MTDRLCSVPRRRVARAAHGENELDQTVGWRASQASLGAEAQRI